MRREFEALTDGIADTAARLEKISDRLALIEGVTEWLSTKQPGRDKTPLEQFVATTDDVERGKLILRVARWLGLGAVTVAAAVMGWWRDILEFAQAANGGK